jgi:hypothetical protein
LFIVLPYLDKVVLERGVGGAVDVGVTAAGMHSGAYQPPP